MKINLLQIIALLFLLVLTVQVSAQTDGQEMVVSVTQPESLAGDYDWNGASDWGGEVEGNFCANLVWAGMEETLGCDPIAEDLTDQLVLIRRGTCDFSQKVFNAQEAGARAVVIVSHDQDDEIGLDGTRVMGGGAMAADVTIPAFFLSFNSGEAFREALASGMEIEMCFELSSFFDPIGPYSYQFPLDQNVSLDNLQISVINRTGEEALAVSTRVEILEPSGSITELTSINDFPNNSDEVILTFDPYLPTELGVHEISFHNGLNDEVVVRKFEVTEHTWSTDDGVITGSTGATDENFSMTDLKQVIGSLVINGTEGVATHISFGLGNPAELHTGDEASDLVIGAVYNADADEDGTLDLNDATFDDIIESFLGFGQYVITGNETPNELITVELDDPIVLEEGGNYYTAITYDGEPAATGVAPLFSTSDEVPYSNNRIFTTPMQYDGSMFTGFSGGGTFVIRLHTEGFTVSTDDFQELAKEKLTILSNPVSGNQLMYKLDLEDYSDVVEVRFRNIDGKLIHSSIFNKVGSLQERINVRDLPAGTYFLNVITDEGFRSEKILLVE